MPIEIKELIIKTTISDSQDQVRNDTKMKGSHSAYDQELIIQQCVKQVMEILKSKQER